ncbi:MULTISPECIES: hypothetical protein [unclassified Amycolatopsis]|uniref:hypothetical protein n=1 Tax=unclassified Amycolatopsis TaxID=2618356 RepID=UPI0028763015|nr:MULTISPECIES: hypothetical protein [unclassified Amycolatopsis]MDS0137574.1 hypothetical protein [Amycolatopsis sp. 505]MDS0141769.1 hypothetical protein [Amycolatopsis sp. CM201R]
MNHTKEFDLYSILAVTHRLPSTALQYRTILAHMAGRDVSQIGGAGVSALTLAPECRAWLLEQHPQLNQIPTSPDFDDDADMDAWAAEQAALIGADHLPVTPLPPDRPRRLGLGDLIDAISDANDVNKVFVLDPDKLPRVPKGVTVTEVDFGELTKNARPLVNEYFDLYRREQAKRNGEQWFQHDELADLADEAAKWFEFYMELFRRNARRFRDGR